MLRKILAIVLTVTMMAQTARAETDLPIPPLPAEDPAGKSAGIVVLKEELQEHEIRELLQSTLGSSCGSYSLRQFSVFQLRVRIDK